MSLTIVQSKRATQLAGSPFYIRDGVYQDGWVVNEVMKQRVYEKHYKLRPDDRVLDLGANIGTFSVVAAPSAAQVLSVEPLPENVEVFRMNLSSRPNVNLIDAAVVPDSFDREEIRFYYTGTQYLRGRVEQFAPTGAPRANSSPKWITCRVVRISQLLTFQPTYIKVDIEGAEKDIMAQLWEANPRALVGEYHCFKQDWLAPREKIKKDAESYGYVIEIEQTPQNYFTFWATRKDCVA